MTSKVQRRGQYRKTPNKILIEIKKKLRMCTEEIEK